MTTEGRIAPMEDEQSDDYPAVPEGFNQQVLFKAPLSIVLTDPNQDDNPIIYVNRAFVETTGYAPQASVGRNCRFLQGKDSDQEAVAELRRAIQEQRETAVDLVNYRANGERFINRLMITPLFGDDGKLAYFLGAQTEHAGGLSHAEKAYALSEQLREIQHRVKNHLSMIVSMIRLEARRGDGSRQSVEIMANRAEALTLLYEQIDHAGLPTDNVALGAYVSRISSALQLLSPNHSLTVNVTADQISVDVDTASRIALILSEILTNALQHAFDEDAQGEISIELAAKDGISLIVTDNGRGLGDSGWPSRESLGGRIVIELVDRLRARLDVSSGSKSVGTHVRLDIPYAQGHP